MSKPILLNRLKNKRINSVTPGNVVSFDDSTGIITSDSGVNSDQLKDLVANNFNFINHIGNNKIHTTLEEKQKIQTTADTLNDHITSTIYHISESDRANWDAKETPDGAQAKINAATVVYSRHIDNTSIHVSQFDRLNWDNKYTREEINNKFVELETNSVWKEAVDSLADAIIKYPSPQKGWTITVMDDNVTYRYDGDNWIPISSNSIPLATPALDGKMSAVDKAKLDGIENGANKYIHPDTKFIRHVTDREKAYWNAKAENALATYQIDGLLSKEDKLKLDSIEEGATRSRELRDLSPSVIAQDDNNNFVTVEEKNVWNSKAPNILATVNLNGLMSKEDKLKLNSVQYDANYYEHPTKHQPDIIIQDTTHRFVTDEQISNWNNKLDNRAASGTEAGFMSAEDKAKLDTIEEGANKYKLPEKLPPSIIADDPNHRFFTDYERTILADKFPSKNIIVGTGKFNSQTGTTIEHNVGTTTYAITVTPITNPNGSVGEIWVKRFNNIAIVYCSGPATNDIEFNFIIINGLQQTT